MRVAAAAGLHRQLHDNESNDNKSDEKITKWRWGSFTAIPILRPAVCCASGNCKPCCQVSQLNGPVKKLQMVLPDDWLLVTAGSFTLRGCNVQLENGKWKANPWGSPHLGYVLQVQQFAG